MKFVQSKGVIRVDDQNIQLVKNVYPPLNIKINQKELKNKKKN